MWPDDFVRYKDEFKEDRVCLVKATVERTREEPGLILTRVLSLEQAKVELTRWACRHDQHPSLRQDLQTVVLPHSKLGYSRSRRGAFSKDHALTANGLLRTALCSTW